MTNCDPSWHHYFNTILEFGDPVALSVDLRQSIDDNTIKDLRALNLSNQFAVITAANPGGVTLDETANAVRDRDLKADLERRGAGYVTVTGCSPDGAHREDGVAVTVELDDALEIARTVGQTAIFWFDGEGFLLVSTDNGRQAIRLPSHEQRWRE